MSKDNAKRRATDSKTPKGRDMRSALSASLSAEASAFKSRFERAEAALGTSAETQSPTPPVSEPTSPTEAEASKRALVIRDSFTMPEADYATIAATRDRCLKNAVHVTKAEVLRAGLLAISELSDEELLALLSRLEKVPTGRPKF